MWSPASPGQWSIAAFSVHPTLGLGVAAPLGVATAVPLALAAELPDSLQRGEALAVVIILHNSSPADLDVEVTFHNSDQYFEFEPLENTVEATKSKIWNNKFSKQ